MTTLLLFKKDRNNSKTIQVEMYSLL